MNKKSRGKRKNYKKIENVFRLLCHCSKIVSLKGHTGENRYPDREIRG
jgi:hypothetical protein